MNRRYLYALVRCVPDPRTGEFVNIGAIAGDPEAGDWAVRRVSSEKRAIKLAGASSLEAVHGFLARTEEAIEIQQALFDQQALQTPAILTEEWLTNLHRDHRNVVQLSAPTPMMAGDAEEALDVVFERMIIDPVTEPRTGGTTKNTLFAGINSAYRFAQLPPDMVRQRAEVFVGANLHSPVDFAIANGVAVQLTQAWSFQVSGIADISTQVKSWAYAMRRVRDGEEARVMSADSHMSRLAQDVDLQVVVAEPRTKAQSAAYEEAVQVFRDLDATINGADTVDAVAARAAELIASH